MSWYRSRPSIHHRAIAASRGVVFGRPSQKAPENFGAVIKQWRRGSLPLADVLAKTGLKKATFYRRFREFQLGKGRSVVSKGTHFETAQSGGI